jgi:glycosyltransferase involved in cell wall biosynthesis
MVASRISGNEDFVRTGENGWLFDPDDEDALARSLEAAAALTPAQRLAMGENARATVRRQAGLDEVLASLMQLYRGSDEAPLPAFANNRTV